MNKLNRKLLLIKSLLGEIESECKFALILHKDSQTNQVNPDIAENLQIYFEIVKYIVNIAEVPENICVVRAYLTSDNLYSMLNSILLLFLCHLKVLK